MTYGVCADDWAGLSGQPNDMTGEMIIYVLLYFITVFLMMQNFLLAIIVEDYMNVKSIKFSEIHRHAPLLCRLL